MADSRILLLADDLTGALEVGSKFAAAGVRSLVKTWLGFLPHDLQTNPGALVVDTETRHAPAAEAARRVYELARTARDQEFTFVYKKTDSTLRGNIGAELEAAARALIASDAFHLAAGSSGLVSHLARLVDLPRSPSDPLPVAKNVLVVNGSLHHHSLEQIAAAKQDGFRSFDARSTRNTPVDCGWTILEQDRGADQATLQFAKDLAKDVCRLLSRVRFDALVVFGGDTAFAIVEAMGNPPLQPIGEVMEGIPISKIDAKTLGTGKRDLFLVTKAGGFGPRDVLTLIRRSISES